MNTEDAVWAHGFLFSVLLFGSLPVFYHWKFSNVPYFLSLAMLSIYIGAHRSLDSDAIEQVTLQQVRPTVYALLTKVSDLESVGPCVCVLLSVWILLADKVFSRIQSADSYRHPVWPHWSLCSWSFSFPFLEASECTGVFRGICPGMAAARGRWEPRDNFWS